MHKIVSASAHDVRFPTSRTLAGSDAMHTQPDYSAAYVVLKTDAGDGLEGHGLAFTLGRGTEVVVAAINALAPFVMGRTLNSIATDMRGFWRAVTGEQQLRWIGPEKGAIHLAAAALVNAVWDLYAKVEGKPLWKLLVDMSPEQLIASIDFRYISDALTPDEGLAILKRLAPTRAAREAEIVREGYPAYTTSAGWLGYSDEKLRALCREAVAGGVGFGLQVVTLVGAIVALVVRFRRSHGVERQQLKWVASSAGFCALAFAAMLASGTSKPGQVLMIVAFLTIWVRVPDSGPRGFRSRETA